MSDHRTSYQLLSNYVVEESHKDSDNATQPKQAMLMDIPAEPCPQSSSHADCDVLQQLQDSAPKDDFLENSLGSQDNTSLETSELEPCSPDTLSLSPASPLLSFSQKMEELVYCANPLTHSPGQNMSDHRTSYQLPSHYVVEESHKDTDNATQPKQALLMDIPAEPCPQSSSHADCDVLQQLRDSAPKDDFLEYSLGSHGNRSPETPELEPRSPDTLSLSPASPLLSFSQKMEELVYAGTKLSASPQISTKKRRAPQPPKTAGSALPPPPVRALRPLPQRQGPNPPPSAVGEPKTTDNSSQ